MLKPLNKSKAVSKKEEKPSQVIVSLVNGVQIYSDADTGKVIDMSHNRFTPAYEVFNNEKASIFLSSISQGLTLPIALENASINKATFSTWLMSNEEFSTALDSARSIRAQVTHEKFVASTFEELTKDIPDDKEELSLHLAKLSVIERRQKILGIQKKEDNPRRFSDKDMSQSVSASVAISIDPEIINKMQVRFKTNVTSDGELDTSSSDNELKDILNAEFKEIVNE